MFSGPPPPTGTEIPPAARIIIYYYHFSSRTIRTHTHTVQLLLRFYYFAINPPFNVPSHTNCNIIIILCIIYSDRDDGGGSERLRQPLRDFYDRLAEKIMNFRNMYNTLFFFYRFQYAEPNIFYIGFTTVVRTCAFLGAVKKCRKLLTFFTPQRVILVCSKYNASCTSDASRKRRRKRKKR